MAKLFGALNLNDSERIFNLTSGQSLIWDASQDVLRRYNEDMTNIMDIFVEGTTTEFKQRYKLPGYGTLQKQGQFAKSGHVKSGGSWDVAYPLEQYGDSFAWDDITRKYMTMKEYDLHFQTILNDDAGTLRILMFNALFNNAATTFVDPLHGNLTIQPLANNDATLYPATIGSTTEAAQNNYLVSGYAAASINDTNNPIVPIVNQLEGLFGAPTGGSNIWIFVNNAQTAQLQNLAAFVDVNDRGIVPGDTTATVTGMPMIPPNMRLLGRCSGAWVFEWRRIPANYMLAIHGDMEKPLMIRKDPDDTGLPTGLNLISREETYPFTEFNFRRRIGFGVGNRLTAVVMYLATGSTYSVPTISL